ncbi:carboxypeptidase B-like [Tubulanus polymorphus]|uniref:carboxypeptidase B-like n=1 Tax=Tubulanus polymorphus TaxID=672921 RepID=UPI003DA3294E
MQYWIINLVLTVSCGALVVSCEQRFDGYKLLAVEAASEFDERVIDQLIANEQVDAWSKPKVGHPGLISVNPVVFDNVTAELIQYGINFNVTLDNLQRNFDEQKASTGGFRTAHSKYLRYSEIVRFIEDKVRQNEYYMPIAKFSVGKTVEGRDIFGIKIGMDNAAKAIWIDGGIHAREWISPATMVYTIDKIISLFSNRDPLITAMIFNTQIIIVPVLNPDGYEYTWSTYRLWRKNRRVGRSCDGVDLNRNWGYHWMEQGASSSECSQIYAGPSAMSEPETKAVAKFILSRKNQIKMYLSFHAYGQYFLTPWGYGRVYPDDFSDLRRVAQNAVNAIRDANGPVYSMGTSAILLYPAAGGSDDWAKGVAGIKYSYTIELPDNGRYGFALPPRYIEPVGRETWPAFVSLFKHVLNDDE